MTRDKIWDLISKKLSGEATASELQELGELLKKEPDMHYPIQSVTDLWGQGNEMPGDAYEAFKRHMQRMEDLDIADFKEKDNAAVEEADERPGLRQKIFTWSLFTLLFIVLSGAGVYFFRNMYGVDTGLARQQAPPEKSEVSTKNGSRTRLQLPDGTQVWLNSGSKLSYNNKNYGIDLREVSLSGEAYFDVVKNPAHPFVIHTSKINIRVLGTAFNVKSYPGEKNTETSLIRGSIEVTFNNRPAEKIILKPNEKLVIANDEEQAHDNLSKNNHIPATVVRQQEPIVAISHLTYIPQDSTIVETSWMEGKLIFRSETFEDLAASMERWYGVHIRFDDEAIRKQKFTGAFENETVEQALKALQFIAPFNYTVDKKDIVIRGNR